MVSLPTGRAMIGKVCAGASSTTSDERVTRLDAFRRAAQQL